MLKVIIKSDSLEKEKELDEQLIKNAIESQIRQLQRSLQKTEYLLKQFEEKYQISSQFFLEYWTAEDLDKGDDEYISWLGEIKTKEKLIDSLKKLQQIKYVNQ